MPHLLKILSGTLAGVEYRLGEGDTIFHIGPRSGLEDGTAARLLGGSENTFYLPDDEQLGAFRVHVPVATEDVSSAQPRIDVRVGHDGQWVGRDLHLQDVVVILGLHVAVRLDDQPWSSLVTDFVPGTERLPAMPDRAANGASTHVRSRRGVAVTVATLIVLAGSGAWYYWQHQPAAQLRELGSVMQGAPTVYQLLVGKDGRLHVFADDAAARTWGERASRRLDRARDVHHVTRTEALRLEERLIAAGMEVVVVRLDDARQPEVVLFGAVDAGRRLQVTKALDGQMPYATSLAVSGVSDRQLLEIARRRLATLGISSQTVPGGDGRTSVMNSSTLDDAGLQAMAAAASAYHQRWGQRRLTIQPQLWDDLLQGRSYRYSPGQLISIGKGRWHYASGLGAAGHATP